MAIYYLGMKTFGRGAGKAGSRATSAAAYRSGERIRDERTGAVYDHSRRRDVLHKEVVLPERLASRGATPDWARDRSRLWNAAEHAERRANARVAREFTIALPHELSSQGRTALALRFAKEIADRYRGAVDVAIHAARGDARNVHAHLLATTREVTAEGLGRKTALELSGRERRHLGMLPMREELILLRERWAELANGALRQEHIAARVSHLSREARGLVPAGAPRLPLAAYHMERRGERSRIAERIREKFRRQLEGERHPVSRQSPAREPEPRIEEPGVSAEAARLRRLELGVRAAWRAVSERIRGHLAPGRESTELDSRRPPQHREIEADRAPVGARTRDRQRSAHASSRPDIREIRQSWLTESQRAARRWLRFRESQAREPDAGRSHGLDHEPRTALDHGQEHRRDNDYGIGL